MIIHSEIEESVRVALSAAVTQNEQRFGNALVALKNHPADQVFGLVHAIGASAMADINNRESVSEERIEELTANFREVEDWIDSDGLPVRAVIRGLAYPADAQPVSADELLVTEILVDAWLLSGFLGDDEEYWYEYLDKILLRFEASA